MEEGDLKTIPTKDVTYVEVDETASPNDFEDPLQLLFGSFKLASKAPNIRMVPRPLCQPLARCKLVLSFRFAMNLNLSDAGKSYCIVINYLEKSFFALSWVCSKQNSLWKKIGTFMSWNKNVMLTKAQ